MRKQTLLVFPVALCLLATAACQRPEANDPSTVTQTIAPAAAQPSPTGTDAMTQTVDIEDSRSEAEGGVITSPNPPVRTGTGAPILQPTTTTQAPPKKP